MTPVRLCTGIYFPVLVDDDVDEIEVESVLSTPEEEEVALVRGMAIGDDIVPQTIG